MRDLNEVLIFDAVASRGSFIAASRALGIPMATVSRKVQDLETRLGVRLLQRSTRRMALTEAGAAFHEHCSRIAEEVEDAEAAVSRLKGGVRGTLRVRAPFTLARVYLVPRLPEFLQRHPDLRVELMLRNEFEDVISHGADVALTTLPLPDSSYLARVLGSTTANLYAAPSYLERRGAPKRPEDLALHATLVFAPLARPGQVRWPLESDARRVEITLVPLIACNDFTPLYHALLAGAGICMVPDAFAQSEVDAGQLLRVLPQWRGPTVEAKVVYAGRRGMLPKVRAFLDFLSEAFAPPLARSLGTGKAR
jgi:DNA-binding transcriptional LysR family regulator